MSTAITSQSSGPSSGSPEHAPEAALATSAANRAVGVRTLRPAIGLGVLALVSLIVFALNASGQSVDFRVSNDGDAIRLPDVSVASTLCGWVVTAVLAVLAGYAAVRARALPRWAWASSGWRHDPFALGVASGDPAPDGVVLDRNRFERVYSSYDLQFFDPSWTYLVPDTRWFPMQYAATSIAEALVNGGPSTWLEGAVSTAFVDEVLTPAHERERFSVAY